MATPAPGTPDTIFAALRPLCGYLGKVGSFGRSQELIIADLHEAVYGEPSALPIVVGALPPGLPDKLYSPEEHEDVMNSVVPLFEGAVSTVSDLVDLHQRRRQEPLPLHGLYGQDSPLLRFLQHLVHFCMDNNSEPPRMVCSMFEAFALEVVYMRWFREAEESAWGFRVGTPAVSLDGLRNRLDIYTKSMCEIQNHLELCLGAPVWMFGTVEEVPWWGVRPLRRIWLAMMKWVPVAMNCIIDGLDITVQELDAEMCQFLAVVHAWSLVAATPVLRAETNPVEVFQLACLCFRALAKAVGDPGLTTYAYFNVTSKLVCMALDVLWPVLASNPDLVVLLLESVMHNTALFRELFALSCLWGCKWWGSLSGKTCLDTLWNVGLGAGLPPGHALHASRSKLREEIRKAVCGVAFRRCAHEYEPWQYLMALAEVSGETAIDQFVSLSAKPVQSANPRGLLELTAVRHTINARWSANRSAWASSVVRGVQERERVAAFVAHVKSGKRTRKRVFI